MREAQEGSAGGRSRPRPRRTGRGAWRVVAVMALTAGASACSGDGGSGNGADGGGSPGGGSTVSCTLTQGSASDPLQVAICEEVAGLPAAQVEQLRQECMAAALPDAGVTAQAVFANRACSHDNALGGCRVAATGGVAATIWYYAAPSGGFTADDIRMLCAASGATYVAP
jgi:hypothetical protein